MAIAWSRLPHARGLTNTTSKSESAIPVRGVIPRLCCKRGQTSGRSVAITNPLGLEVRRNVLATLAATTPVPDPSSITPSASGRSPTKGGSKSPSAESTYVHNAYAASLSCAWRLQLSLGRRTRYSPDPACDAVSGDRFLLCLCAECCCISAVAFIICEVIDAGSDGETGWKIGVSHLYSHGQLASWSVT